MARDDARVQSCRCVEKRKPTRCSRNCKTRICKRGKRLLSQLVDGRALHRSPDDAARSCEHENVVAAIHDPSRTVLTASA